MFVGNPYINIFDRKSELVAAVYALCDWKELSLMGGGVQRDIDAGIVAISEQIAKILNTRVARIQDRPYSPKLDWSKATPRLPDKEWYALTGIVYRRDGYICTYCETQEAKFCVDHVVPLSRGGTNDPDNLVVACMPCNSSKGFKMLHEWQGRRYA